MFSVSFRRARSPLGRRITQRSATGRAASAALLFAFLSLTFGAGLTACGKDDAKAPAEPTGSAVDTPDASVRDLPGDGLEPTPESDIDARQLTPSGPGQLNESVDRIRNGASNGSRDAGTPGSSTGADAGADNGTN